MDNINLRQLTVLDKEIAVKDKQIAKLIKVLTLARTEIARGGHLDRWKTVDLINSTIEEIENNQKTP